MKVFRVLQGGSKCWMAGLSLALLQLTSAPAFAGQCQLHRLEVPVTMNGLRPTVTAQINGVDALFTLDSGAFWSALTPAAAEQYGLHPDATRLPGLYVIGVNGRAEMKVATVAIFTIFNLPVHKFDFLVGGTDPGAGTVGLLGQNILRIADIEYDLAQGAVRILKTENCKKSNLAYWAKPGESYSMVDILTATAQDPHTVGTAYLNGAKIRVTFDTGSPASIVGLRAAERAGIKPGSLGVEPDELIAGVGRRWVKTWIATFPTLKIGDEEVHNARLHFGDIGDTDMLLGADFFLSHHIYVASSQSKIYFTYNGGPVFNLAAAAAQAKRTATVPISETSPSDDSTNNGGSADDAAASEPAMDLSTPADAPALARRAAAYMARRDFEHALQDYNRACELAPNEAAYFYHRSLVHYDLGHAKESAGDIDEAIKLKPDYVEALIVRAEIELAKDAKTEALKDIEAADRLAPKEGNLRYTLAGLYFKTNQWAASIVQLDLWIASHSQDARLSHALNDRCWSRAILNQGLDQALDDCNRALRLEPNSAPKLDSRGFVHLRRREFEKAIADYDAALKIDPKAAWSLYCRGLAKTRTGKTADGATDMSNAATLDPHVAERAKRYGIG